MNEHMNPRRWLILWIVNIGTFISTLDVGIVNVALPTMADEFGVNLSVMQWVVTSYLLALVAFLPILGKLSDGLGRSRVYSLGFFVFTLGSLAIALSNGIVLLIVFRCVQGLGAAMIMANSQAMVRQVFPNHERGKALGINAIIISLGTLSGPAIGGALLEITGWPFLFWINVPFGLAAVILGMKWFPKIETRAYGKLDIVGSIILAVSVSLMLVAAVTAEEEGFSKETGVYGFVGFVLLILLLVYERRTTDGIIDFHYFKDRIVWVGNSSAFLIHLTQMATMIPITFYLQTVLKYEPAVVGMFLALQPIVMGVTAPLAGWYRDRVGAKIPVMLGAALCSISCLLILWPGPIHALTISLQLAFFGAGMGLFQATNNADIMTASPSNKLSMAGSMIALLRYLGMIAGIGLAVLFVGHMGGASEQIQQLDTNMKTLFTVCFALNALVLPLMKLRFQKNATQEANVST